MYSVKQGPPMCASQLRMKVERGGRSRGTGEGLFCVKSREAEGGAGAKGKNRCTFHTQSTELDITELSGGVLLQERRRFTRKFTPNLKTAPEERRSSQRRRRPPPAARRPPARPAANTAAPPDPTSAPCMHRVCKSYHRHITTCTCTSHALPLHSGGTPELPPGRQRRRGAARRSPGAR